MSAAATVARSEGAMSKQTAATIAWQAHYTAKSGVAKVRGRGQPVLPLSRHHEQARSRIRPEIMLLRYKGVDEGKMATMDEPEKRGMRTWGMQKGDQDEPDCHARVDVVQVAVVVGRQACEVGDHAGEEEEEDGEGVQAGAEEEVQARVDVVQVAAEEEGVQATEEDEGVQAAGDEEEVQVEVFDQAAVVVGEGDQVVVTAAEEDQAGEEEEDVGEAALLLAAQEEVDEAGETVYG
jgi:hypothetical protein